ncbi:type II secretion system protein [Alteribacter natronophilus]|uniref:type II secretion system protein n=1 Tax=Alteribacter natronophilus TaxID=2583810 RepID=UPI00110D4CEB|nr:type II secretion system protein [Alteribacter natronophilus]TMW73779.1 type II secretion system protein [Alteribacter natronophilus]
MRDCNGFTLTEVLAALVLFAVIGGTLVPVYWHFQLEQERLRQERFIAGKLYDFAQIYRHEGTKSSSFTAGGFYYPVSWVREGSEWRMCVEWEYEGFEVCLHVPVQE